MNFPGDTIEDLILSEDKRGVSQLRPFLPEDFCDRTARYILEHPGRVAIVTGFYILTAGQHETDGPPGALAIGSALQALGNDVTYVTDVHTAPMLRGWLGDSAGVVEFPIAGDAESRASARSLIDELRPDLLISIERCGRNASDVYLNMLSRDITEFTARLDYLFELGIPSVGIGDGGNEIGMGNVVEHIPPVATLPDEPAISTVDRLLIASVSNWGGYGLVAALSLLAGRNLLPSVEAENRLITRMVDEGAVDGGSGLSRYYVDNFTLEENGELLELLHQKVNHGLAQGQSA
ncbi:MAG: DUF4392 domain-containing protein [Chloroflexota bacterium]|nr:DUF4392 domain-containing protein [Chloroflexota bacterium]